MAAHFALSKKGLDYLVSEPSPSASSAFLFSLLMYSSDRPASISQLAEWTGFKKNEAVVMIYQMLKQGWLHSIEAEDYEDLSLYGPSLNEQLATLSSTGSAILASDQGLVIAQIGFEGQQIDYLVANAARMLAMNETAKQYNLDVYDGRPWTLTLDWGSTHVNMQLIRLYLSKFVLIIGGVPQLDNSHYFSLLARLARRYASGQ